MTKRDPQAARSLIRLFLLVAAFSALAAWEPVATADPRLMPQPALLPHYSPLCDSNLVGCPRHRRLRRARLRALDGAAQDGPA